MHLPAQRFEARVHRRPHGLVGLALLDALVNALLDEETLQRAKMQLLLELVLLQLQFALEQLDQLPGILRSTSDTVVSTGRLSLITTMRLAMVTSQSVKRRGHRQLLGTHPGAP